MTSCNAPPLMWLVPGVPFIVLTIFICADMRDHFVIDPLIGKRQQLLLATQLCRMVLKVYVLRLSSMARYPISGYQARMSGPCALLSVADRQRAND